ncbi:MAG: hypothetical protein ABSC92_16155, partial [Rhizomicrobium sp.]
RTDTNSDALLTALIARASRDIYSYLQRPLLLPRTVTETRDGTGGTSMILKQWPVISVASLVVGDIAIPPAASDSGTGYVVEQWDGAPPGRPQALSLRGHAFCLGAQTATIVYQSGYQVSAELQTVSGGTATVNAPFGAWASDMGVIYADGAALTPVASSPAVGQYALGAAAGSYDFNAGDDGASVLISYGFVPSDLADACIELVSERIKYSERIGERTHSLGGNETVAFDTTRLTPLIAGMLQPYKNLLPA